MPNIWWAGTPNYTSGNYGVLYLFPHWTAGGFDGSVSTLKNPDRQASAHYVIEGDNVAQLVSEDDSAWHCGNGWYNMRSISYELVGWPGNPPSRSTLDTAAELMAEASQRYFGGARLVLWENVMLHKYVSSTSCPGETDIDYLLEKANSILEDEMTPEEVASAVWNAQTTSMYSGGQMSYGDILRWTNDDTARIRDATCEINGKEAADYIKEPVDTGASIGQRMAWSEARIMSLCDKIDKIAEKLGIDGENSKIVV